MVLDFFSFILETFRNPIYLQMMLVTPRTIWSLELKAKTAEGSICGIKIMNKLLYRGGSRTVATSKMERFVMIVNGF